MKDALAGKFRHLVSIHHLKRRIAANIKRLKEVRGMRRHAESNDFVVFAVLIELRCCMTVMAVKESSLCAPVIRDSVCLLKCLTHLRLSSFVVYSLSLRATV